MVVHLEQVLMEPLTQAVALEAVEILTMVALAVQAS
jgi:hypothetical protein